jgi:mRNA-degrading endonuclease HigB of HigAB toxin-antitoxin module
VEKVTPEEWDTYKDNLKQAYQRMDKLFHENKAWNEDTIGGALSIVVHTAYHLGEIRQALCTLK